MTNFLKWIEYLATEPNYIFQEVKKGYLNQIYFTLHFTNDTGGKSFFADNYFNSYINLTEYEPKKLLTWYNNQTQYALNNGYKNDYYQIFYTAQHFLKLIKELKANGIDFKDYETNISHLELNPYGISMDVTKKQQKQHYWLNNKEDFRDLNKSTIFQLLLNFLKGINNGTESK